MSSVALAPSNTPIDCSQVLGPPPAPVNNAGASVDKNIAAVQQRGSSDPGSYMSNMAWFANQVRDGGNWDYKKGMAEGTIERQNAANFGNFNYGATCGQFLGSTGCQYAAGAVGGFVGPKTNAFDRPIDNYYVKVGYTYGVCKRGF